MPINEQEAAESGAWLKDGAMVYTLTENPSGSRSRRHGFNYVNRFSALVQRGEKCTEAEAQAAACIMQMAPELARAVQQLLDVDSPFSVADRVEHIKARDAALELLERFESHMGVLNPKQDEAGPTP